LVIWAFYRGTNLLKASAFAALLEKLDDVFAFRRRLELPPRGLSRVPGFPAACAWAAGMERAGVAVEHRIIRGLVDVQDEETIRAEFDASARVECARRPFEGIF
jgi:hypothetical protein